MSKSLDCERAALRGRKCEECGHALAAHNSLGYCSRRSRLYGECICPATRFDSEKMRYRVMTLEEHKAMWREHAARVRSEDRRPPDAGA